MKAIDILNYFLSQADWVDPETTVDRIIVGDPEKEVRRVLVTWISSFSAVREAVRRGCDMLITHEPTFWTHAGELRALEQWEEGSEWKRIGMLKKKYIEDNGLVIMRNHDVWDRFPEYGIPWAWARFLEVGEKPVAIGNWDYQHRYDIEPVSFGELVQRVADKVKVFGEYFVQAVGDFDRMVSKVGIGTGCVCNISVYKEMGCDVSIVCDDGSTYWSDIQCAKDDEHPVIRVNHGTSEEPGMISLTEYINKNLPGIEAEHLPHGCSFKPVAAR